MELWGSPHSMDRVKRNPNQDKDHHHNKDTSGSSSGTRRHHNMVSVRTLDNHNVTPMWWMLTEVRHEGRLWSASNVTVWFSMVFHLDHHFFVYRYFVSPFLVFNILIRSSLVLIITSLSIDTLSLLFLVLWNGIKPLSYLLHLIIVWSCGHYYKVQGWTHVGHM